uniref:Serum amyloid A protein n=1 Tax=Equus caballus TaxID=9796 RepID=A0A9L0T4F7_HORSE
MEPTDSITRVRPPNSTAVPTSLTLIRVCWRRQRELAMCSSSYGIQGAMTSGRNGVSGRFCILDSSLRDVTVFLFTLCPFGRVLSFPGTWDMLRAYNDMREANYIGADKYFHARGNYDAAKRGPGGAWAAKVISDARENVQRFTDRFSFGGSGRGAEDSRADQAANEWGRSGRDPNHFRPHGLPDKY